MKTKLLYSAILFSFLFSIAFSSKVNAQCQAGFSWTAIGGTVQFTDTSTSNSLYPLCNWTFGDNTSLNTSGGTSHVYALAGTYQVCLTITDSVNFCTSTFCDSVTVLAGCNNLYVTATSTDASVCQTCDGTVSATPNGGTAPYTFYWSNNATTTTQTNLCIGNYSITIVDANGCTANANTNISCPFQCHAGIGYSANGNTAYFSNTSNDSTNCTFQWSFGDNTFSSAGYGGLHTYATSGTYNVMLIMVNAVAPCTDTAYASVTVGGPNSCGAGFNMQQDSFNLSLWNIYPSVTGQAPFTYLWDFGDTTTSTQAFPTHNYTYACHHVVCLTTSDANSCSSIYCDSSLTHRLNSSTYMMSLSVIDTTKALGINEPKELTGSTFPNPVSDLINVSFNKNVSGTIRMTDITGKIIFEKNFVGQQKQIDVSLYPQGIYNLSLINETINWNEKVVIIH